MKCRCGKPLVEREVATKTRKVDGGLVILRSETAQVCDDCGVICWGARPTTTIKQPWLIPNVQPTPWRPYTVPQWPTVSPNSAQPLPKYPQITCGSQNAAIAAGLRYDIGQLGQ